MVAWVTVVAWHEVQNEWRRQARVELGEVPECADRADPAAAVERRLELQRVVNSLMDLSVTEREAILGAPEPAADAAERARNEDASVPGPESPRGARGTELGANEDASGRSASTLRCV